MTAPESSTNINVPNVSANSNSIHANVIPSEVGWQFVPQYYTFVNKQPHRLHCFYTKNSTFIHGTEGEDGRPCYGQQEIHNKILSIGFQDCKVFIHSVDAQSSANGGIIIQVIGEMSNRGDPWRKFAQTFFLAEQPNGYFVLNDIFRFLKEESVEADDDDQSDAAVAPAQPDAAAAAAAAAAPEVAASTAQETADLPAAPAVQAAAVLPEHLQSVTPEPEPEPVPAPAPAYVEQVPPQLAATPPQPNGIHHPVPAPALAPTAEPEPVPAPVPAPALDPPKQSDVPTPEPVRPASPPSRPAASPAPPPAVAAAAAAPSKPAPTPSPKPVAPPPAPKTWANLAAANSNKWGPQVAQEARGVSAAPPPAPVPVAKPEPPRPAGGPGPGAGPGADKDARDGARELHPAHQAALGVATPQCFVKSVTEVISHAALSNTLTSRFGPIKELEIVRSKACAFLEFTTLDAARRAIVASLPIPAGGDGGVRVELEGGGSARISVETRKERSERPPPRPRTGVPPGQDRGGFRGGPGRGRGGGGGPARGGPGGKP